MMKRLIAAAGAGAVLLGLAAPVLGCYGSYCWMFGSRDTAVVNNSAVSVADTGGNSQSSIADVTHGGGVNVYGGNGNRFIETGNANSYAGALTVANSYLGCCYAEGWCQNDYASVTNGAMSAATTGSNYQDSVAKIRYGGGVDVYGGTGNRTIDDTGTANSTARAWTIVNTNLSWY